MENPVLELCRHDKRAIYRCASHTRNHPVHHCRGRLIQRKPPVDMLKLPCHPQASLFSSYLTATKHRHQQPSGRMKVKAEGSGWLSSLNVPGRQNMRVRSAGELYFGGWVGSNPSLCKLTVSQSVKFSPAIMGFILMWPQRESQGGVALTRTSLCLINQERCWTRTGSV